MSEAAPDDPAASPDITLSDRGFQQSTLIPSSYGGYIRVYESSAAMGPHLWVHVICPISFNSPAGPTREALAHLSLDSARELRDQLTYLIDHHYQSRSAD